MRKYYSGRLLYIKDPKRYKEVITNGDKFHNQNVKDAEEYVKDYGVFIFTPTKGGYREISTGRTFGYVIEYFDNVEPMLTTVLED